MDIVVVVDKDNTHFSYEFKNVKAPINDRTRPTGEEVLVIRDQNSKVIAVFKEWSLWKEKN